MSGPEPKAQPDTSQQVRSTDAEGQPVVNMLEEFEHTWRIWVIFLVLALLSFLAAVDSSIITTSLSTITREIGGSSQYVWIANSYLFASTVPQPLYDQISNIFSRQNPFFASIILFFVGSGLAGGARNAATLIATRVIQGLATIGNTAGPIIGGALAQPHAGWRWIFWINLPVAAAWIGFQIIAAAGTGFVFTVSLPSTLAALSESDVAVATGTFAFINAHPNAIEDHSVRQLLADGAAYTYAAGLHSGTQKIGDLPKPSRSQVINVYAQAMHTVWLVFVGMSCLGFVATFIEKHIKLRKNHITEFGLVDKEVSGTAVNDGAP
ncbi:hypothetical protein DL766_008792 [Monosporascus sp. MC13-8B]|nr:hypothetical protein DL763_006165 [Monosporascus cannonballus]RYP17898.1 hypothetical protein DL766_008792 [Monosporascus sp. MC13-8B]